MIDGRDVPPTSALEYVERFDKFLDEINADGSVDYCVASGGGRMNITMDRYNANWSMVERGWNTHVKAEGRRFATMREAVETFRKEQPGILDQDLPAFVIERDGAPVGPIVDGDSVIFFNFRGDRSLEITKAFEAEELTEFDRGPKPDVLYAGMMQYDGDLGVPEKYLVSPPAIDRTMSEYLSNAGVKQFAISETQKFGHVTYFFNGNNSGKVRDRNLAGDPFGRLPVRGSPAHEGGRDHRRRGQGHRERRVPIHTPELSQRRHGRPHRCDGCGQGGRRGGGRGPRAGSWRR